MEEKKPVSHLLDTLKNHIEYLKKYQLEILTPLNCVGYPIKNLLLLYQKKIIPKLVDRQSKSEVLSDILMWFTPDLITCDQQIQVFIGSLSEEQKNTSAKTLKPELQDDSTTEAMLRVPQLFIEETLVAQAKSSIVYNQEHDNSTEAKSLERFTTLFQQSIQKYKHSKESSQKVRSEVLSGLYEDVSNPKSRIAIKYSVRLVFISKLKTRVKKADKRIRERKHRILELIDGEKKYVAGLEEYIEWIKNPIEALNILSKEEDMKLFSTIESIKSLHAHLHQELKERFQKYSKYETFGDIFRKNIPFFKIYTDYIMYADDAQALLISLEDNEAVDQICNKFLRQKEKKASDELKQPTFRIARYEMILNEIIKNTNPIHPDYPILINAQKEWVVSMRKINGTVDETFRRNRLNQLEQEFGTEERPIFQPNRQFLEEFSLYYVKDEKLEPTIVFVFSDFVMVIDENRKVIKWINVDEKFYVRREQDNKIYRNIIKIHSDGFLTFSAGSEDKHSNKAEQFFNLLQKVSKENEQLTKLVYVQVIGTEEIGSTSFAKHTEYIVEIKYLGLRKFIHLRFSDVKPFLLKVQAHYKDDLSITEEESLKKNWFNNHKSKTIEDRKRTIEQILQKILNHQIVKKNPNFILDELGIDHSFLTRRQAIDKRRLSALANSVMIESSSSIKQKKKQLKEAETILCATQIKLGRDLYHDPEEMILEKKINDFAKIDIYVHTMVGEDPIIVKINELYTVEDVCIKVSKLIGLRMNRDFRLFHQIGKKELRALDQEQKIMKIFSFPKKEAKMEGRISQFFGSVKRIMAPDTHPTLVFKKYYFLPIQIEQAQAKKDLTRLRLLVYQIFSQIKDMKYQLNFDEYLLFLAMLIYIQYDGDIPEETSTSFVERLIPETIFKLKNYTSDQWIAKCRPHIVRLSEEINKIIEYNREQLKNRKIKADSVSKTSLFFGRRHLCSQIVVNKIKSNPIYGSNLFYVQPYKATYDKLLNEGCKMAYNMWLAIKVESLNLLTPSSKETVLELKYKDIQKIFVYSEAIIFKMDGIVTCEYRLNTYQSFEISQLVKYNKALNDTLIELERNEDLITKARMYKEELLIYRNTYDKSERNEQSMMAELQ